MRKIYLALAIAGVLAGCSSNSDKAPVNTTPVPAMGKVADGAFTRFALNGNSSGAWLVHATPELGLGAVEATNITASGDPGSLRLFYPSINESSTLQSGPGVSQIIPNIEPDTDYLLTVYYRDEKGDESPNVLELGVKDMGVGSLAGNTVRTKTFTNDDIDSDGDDTNGFRKVELAFNSGSNTTLEVYALTHLNSTENIDMNGDVAFQTEVFIDDVVLESDD
ncbi:hypothetical protein [Vibrio sp. CK2-1]|uniref:hypothetical protein n=1 Tax=Vibrio sp. CK2-1 TaxID=2912249 RepID=UPI001F2744A2|nr:hypothetical protein [Vibrio sp. CK2-1]MCF7352559.1 hypothetical protein [Vibrio sp. CK2-1]